MKIDPHDPLEIQLMQTIRTKWGVAIASNAGAFPQEFLAALVANESGGDATQKRFEPGVLRDLWDVLMSRRAAYGSIGRQDVLEKIVGDIGMPINHGGTPQWMLDFSNGLVVLDSLATSWGLTQIMGYETIPFKVHTASLKNSVGLHYTGLILAQMATEYGLDLSKDFEKMFDCWNTGRPHAPTADPDYIPNGMARLQLYRDLLEEPPKAISA